MKPLICPSVVLMAVALFSSVAPASADVRAIPVPANGRDYTVPHAAYNGHPITLKAIARGFPDMATAAAARFLWDTNLDGDYSDEASEAPRTCVESFEGVTCYDLGLQVRFPEQASSRLMVFKLRVVSGGAVVATASYPVFLDVTVPAQTDVAVNGTASADAAYYQLDIMRRVALDDALWYLHVRMGRYRTPDGAPAGELGGTSFGNPTMAATRAMMRNGHLPAYPPGSYNHGINPGNWHRPAAPPPAFLSQNDQRYQNDPYAETAMRAVNTVMAILEPHSIAFHDPLDEEDDGTPPIEGTNDGWALRWPLQVSQLAFHGDALAMLAESGLAGTVSQTGTSVNFGLEIKGRPIEYIVQQMVDHIAFAQLDDSFGDDMGGFDIQAGGGRHTPGDNTSRSVFGGLDAAAAMSGAGVYVNNRLRSRLANVLVTNQDPATGLARYVSLYFCGGLRLPALAETGDALLAAKVLGSNLFDATDATIIPGTAVTRGRARQAFDAYIAGLSTQWGYQADDCAVRGLFYNDGGTHPAPYRRTDMRGNIDAIAGVGNGLLRLPNAAEYMTLGGRDWWHELTTYLVRNQFSDGHWQDETWPIPTTAPQPWQLFGGVFETAWAAELLGLEVPLGSLQLTIAPGSAPENAGPAAATATVSRSGGHPGAIRATITSSNTGEATVPAQVIVSPGASSTTFPIATVDDFALDGTQTVTIAVTFPSSPSVSVGATAAIQVVDAGLEVDFGDVSARAATLEQTVARLEGELGAAHGTIDALRVQIEAQVAQIVTLIHERDAANAIVAALESSLLTANQTIGERNARIATLEAELVRANQTIASLREELANSRGPSARLNALIDVLQLVLRIALRDPSFTIPGATAEQRLVNLFTAIGNLNHGQKQALYRALGGRR